MSIAIPANIRYEEKIFGPLTLKQTGYLVIGAGIASYIYFASSFSTVMKNVGVVVVGLITAAFILFNLDIWLSNYFSFISHEKRTSWISPAARKLMNVKSIRADSVYLKENKVIGLLKVKPLNFGVLGEQDKDTVIYGFLSFLNSLNFQIQIVMRSVNLDLEDYLRHLKRRILHRDDKIALAYYEHFAEYMRTYIKANKINDRHFYIVMTVEKKGNEKTTIENLESACERIMNGLAKSGIVSERMNTQQLINLYSSYFTETFDVYDTYISPITIYRKMWKEAPHNVVLPGDIKGLDDKSPHKK